ncbi:putative ribonuclease H-like domain-containing protein, partial [Tanacetum coccineum]
INEEVYVSQPPGFIDPQYPKKVYKVVKTLYGLHQAPRAWYATLSTFLLKNGYRRGTIDKTLFIKKDKHDIILVQVNVDDIIFGSIKKSWCDDFEALMKSRFQMKILKKFDFVSVKTASTPIETQKPLIKDEEASYVDVHLYRSMIGSLMYLTASGLCKPKMGFGILSVSLTGKPIQVYVITLEQILTLESKQGFRQFLAMQKEDHCGYFYYKRTEYVAALQSVVGSSRDSKLNVRHGFNFKTQKILIDNEVQYGIVKNQYITPKQSILP